jgi:hypothetical protein
VKVPVADPQMVRLANSSQFDSFANLMIVDVFNDSYMAGCIFLGI